MRKIVIIETSRIHGKTFQVLKNQPKGMIVVTDNRPKKSEKPRRSKKRK